MDILIIDDVHPILTEGLKSMGHQVEYNPLITKSEVLRCLSGFDGVVVRSKMEFDKFVLSHQHHLRFIARAGAGLDNIDIKHCEAMGIQTFNAGEANADAVGEQTVGILLNLYARITKSDQEVRKGIWDREGNRGRELTGETIGLIGYGNTGKAVARKLSGFGMQVLAYDKYLTSYGDQWAKESTMDQIFQTADILSFHVPLTDETYHLGNSSYFESFAKSFTLLNLSRGKVVNLQDLMNGMQVGKILMAGLDVLENEQIGKLSEDDQRIFNFLANSERTVLTPHIGGWTTASYRKISEVLLQKISTL